MIGLGKGNVELWREKMERFKRYCTDIRDINGIKTCIASQEYLDDILLDSQLLTSLSSIPLIEMRRIAQYLVNEAKSNPTRIFFAFAEHTYGIETTDWWEPVNCYKDGDVYYHVRIRDNWKCRECGQWNHDKFIMPINECDATFYCGTNNKYPFIPPLFKKKKCIYCEKALQNHFIYINE